jgi:hypothetical protein
MPTNRRAAVVQKRQRRRCLYHQWDVAGEIMGVGEKKRALLSGR